MEDLREEPELEEREEEEEEDEEEEDAQEPGADEPKKDEPLEGEENPKEEKKDKDEGNDDDEDDELSLRPVRNKARRASLTDELVDLDSTQCLLETNFSVMGLNEIRTERIMTKTNSTAKDNNAPARPMSLDLNAPVKLKKLRCGGERRPEKVTARLIDSDEVHLQSRNRAVVVTYPTQDK